MSNTPIILIHGYGSEGRDTPASEIYGNLPADLKNKLGQNIEEINLSRWISLSDGVNLDDVSFALERALQSDDYKHLLESGFNCIIHSTGALVVRHWLKHYSPQQSPLQKVIYLAGALFGSGLAHMGFGQLNRWGSMIFRGTHTGLPSLETLEFGSNNTLDLHTHFLEPGLDIRDDFGVYEYCMIGSQTPSMMRIIPNRYIKEDSSDCTLRTAAGNLNFNYLTISPNPHAYALKSEEVHEHVYARFSDQKLPQQCYQVDYSQLADNREAAPFCLLYETAHIGEDIGILDGKKNRPQVITRIKEALLSPNTPEAQQKIVARWHAHSNKTLEKACKLKKHLGEWDPQSQYEAHGQVIFRIRDQYGSDVKEHDITFKVLNKKQGTKLPRLIEDKVSNPRSSGNTTYYFRLQHFSDGEFVNFMDDIVPVTLEVTGTEKNSNNIQYLPLMMRFNEQQLRNIIQPYRTTIIDITLLRIPSEHVFSVAPANVR